jgi:hypothetical protein
VQVYVNAAPLHPERNAAWHKFLLAKAAFEHSCPEYVWLLDSDAYIMNITQSIQQALPEVFALPPEERPDVIVSEDCNDLNSGSFLLRNTPWTRQHLSDAWATTQVRTSAGWLCSRFVLPSSQAMTQSFCVIDACMSWQKHAGHGLHAPALLLHLAASTPTAMPMTGGRMLGRLCCMRRATWGPVTCSQAFCVHHLPSAPDKAVILAATHLH